MPKFKVDSIGIKVNPKMKKALEQIATKHEMSVSEYVRYLIQKSIDNENSNKTE